MEKYLSKLDEMINVLNAKFYEREAEIEALLIAVLARQHILIIGPSGTAKSELAISLAKMMQGARYFQWLLTRFSTPEELFGPLSLKHLEQGVYKRNTETKMPEANIVFLDEIFKANSAILNSLLTIMNERVFYNDGNPAQVPLMTVIGASNEFPEEGEGLEALYDRFLFRFEVDYIKEDINFISMMKNEGEVMQLPTMTLDDLTQLQFLTDRVVIQDEVYNALSTIRKELRDEGIQPSDRRFKQSLRLLQARALIRKKNTVAVEDMIILEHTLWETIDQKDTVSLIVHRHAQDQVIRALDAIRTEAKEIFTMIKRDASVEAGMEANQKMIALELDLEKLKKRHGNREAEINALHVNLKSMQQEILNSILEPMYYNGQNEI